MEKMDERLNKMQEMVAKGMDEIIAKGTFDQDTICLADKLVDINKDIVETMEKTEAMSYGYDIDEGYSGRQGGGNSGRSQYARMNNTGGRSYGRPYPEYQYGSSYGNRGYSRGGGHNQMVEHLNQAMQMATNEQERENIRRMIMQAEDM